MGLFHHLYRKILRHLTRTVIEADEGQLRFKTTLEIKGVINVGDYFVMAISFLKKQSISL